LCELNKYVNWVPGNKPKSTEEQLNLTFHTGMQLHWKEHYINAGYSIQHGNHQSLLHSFRNQQVMSECMAAMNEVKTKAKQDPHRQKPFGIKEMHKQTKHQLKPAYLPDDAKCLIHPLGNHKWGDCYADAYHNNDNHKSITKPMPAFKSKC
jgi:hypothetical protein